MSSIFVRQAMTESGLPQPDTKITDEVFGRLTFEPNTWTKYLQLSYFGIKQSVPIYIHTYDGSINDLQRDCYEEFTSDPEGVLEDYRNILKSGYKIDCLVFQTDSLLVMFTGKNEDDYMVAEFEP